MDSAETIRFDPEYFQKTHLRDEAVVEARSSEFGLFKDLKLTVDASAFYPSIESHYDTGTLPFLRVADVDSVIDLNQCTTVPESICRDFPTLKKVVPGDIVLTKGGSVARIGLVTQNAAVSRDLIFINSSKLPEEEQTFLYLYFQTDFCNRWLIRSSSQTAQPHLTITLVRNLPILKASLAFKIKCVQLVRESYKKRQEYLSDYQKAEQTLIHTIGLEDWQPPKPLTYELKARDVFTTGRLDAEHFKPQYARLEAHIRATESFAFLQSLLIVNERGAQPDYADSGFPVVNSKHVAIGDVKLDDDNRHAIGKPNSTMIKYGDVLMNGTGMGTIGRAAPYLHHYEALPDNHVTILRPQEGIIDPIYLAVFLNSLAGQYQVKKWFRGSSGQIELYPDDISRFIVWIAPDDIQQSIRKAVENAFAAQRQARNLLDLAKRAVEIAIEENETTAMEFLKQSQTRPSG